MAKDPIRNAPEERLVNLVVALTATEQGLTKDTILATISGYREQLESGASKDALEKMFERDKENLRAMGVPIQAIGDTADPDDLRAARYRIPTAEYELPVDITFSSAELALLNLAGGVWSDKSMSGPARSGLRKIRALGIDAESPIMGFAPRISLREPAFGPLQRAIEQGRIVTFDYVKPGERAASKRRLEPLALIEFEARWHVYGIDLDQHAERTFLLTRIGSPVQVTRQSFDIALREGAGERGLAGLRDLAARQSAVLELEPGTEAALRLLRRAVSSGDDIPAQGIRVPYVDAHIFADELASYGPEVRVVEPASLRDLVIARLRAAASLHSITAPAGGASA